MSDRERFCPWGGMLLLCLVLLSGLVVTGCKDDYAYPELREDIMTGYFSHEKGLERVLLDNGSQYKVLESEKTLVYRDSVARIIAMYELVLSGGSSPLMRIYSLGGVYSASPETDLDGPLWGDPISLESAWKSRDHLNLRLLVKTTGKEHGFRFVESSREMIGDTLHVEVLLDHDLRTNKQGYTGHIFASLPLAPYRDQASHLRITILCSVDDPNPHVYEF